MTVTTAPAPGLTRLQTFSVIAGMLVASFGFIVLLTTVLEVTASSTDANTALAYLLAGTSLALLVTNPKRSRIALVLSLLVMIIGLVQFSEYWLNRELFLDDFLGRPSRGVNSNEARSAPVVAAAIALIGISLTSQSLSKTITLSQSLSVGALLFGFVPLVGYTYGVQIFYSVGGSSRITIPTAFGVLVLSLGILASRGDQGLMKAVFGESVGGIMARRLLPVALLLPLLSGWLRLQGQRLGYFDTSTGTAFLTLSNVAVLFVLILLLARMLRKTELERAASVAEAARLSLEVEKHLSEQQAARINVQQSQEQLAELIDSASDAIVSVDESQRIQLFNPAAQQMFGLSQDEISGTLISELLEMDPTLIHTSETESPRAHLVTAIDRRGIKITLEASISHAKTPRGKSSTFILRDVTERQRAEQIAKESEERLHTVLESLTEGLIIADLDGQILHWNKAALNLHGFATLEECLLKVGDFQRNFELSTEDGKVLSLDEWPLPKVIAGERLTDYEVCVTRLDHHWRRTFSYGGSIVKEPNGRLLAFVTVTDITERKKAESRLRSSEQQLSGVIGSAMDAIITVDENQKIVLFNAAAEHMLMFPRDKAIGEDLDRFIPKRFRTAHRKHIEQFGKTNITTRSMGALGALFGSRADGSEFPIEASISQIENDGRTLYTVILRDITERKRAEEALREQARILELAPVLVRDLDGHIRLWNKGAEEMYQWSKDEAFAKATQSLLRTEFPRPLNEIQARLLDRGHWEGELVQYRKDGVRLIVSSKWVLHRDEYGNPMAVLEINNDITERKLAEEEIKRLNEELEQRVTERTAQLQAANKELEAFSYSVSHDLRAPLRHINGFSQALLEDYHDVLDDVGKSYLNELRAASEEMAHLIDDVLQLARVTRTEIHREPVNLSELARGVFDELQNIDRDRSVDINIQSDLAVQCDRRLMRIVLANLLGNAWKFTSQRPRAKVTFGQAKKNGEKVYYISDNGAGFDMAFAGKLFGAFQRLHTSSEFEGTGIGLATVQRIISRHGGRVWAEGKPNEGATFYFALPNSFGDGR